jgi:energy-coupling factor transporter ATP-binding protein EcfA2
MFSSKNGDKIKALYNADVKASDVIPRSIQWLWEGKIAKGKLTLLVGNPGLGKSQITASIAACVSTGNPWPLHSKEREPAKVMMLSGEDDFADTIVPRLTALDANLGNVSLIEFSEGIDRAAFLVMKDENDESKRLFLPMKNNLAIDTGGLSYSIESKIIYTNSEEIKTSVVVWGDTEIKMTANEAMRGSPKNKSPQLKEAESFLEEVLNEKKNGIDGKTIKDMATQVGISLKILYTAADNLGVVQKPDGFGKARIWQLLEFVYTPDKTS